MIAAIKEAVERTGSLDNRVDAFLDANLPLDEREKRPHVKVIDLPLDYVEGQWIAGPGLQVTHRGGNVVIERAGG